MSRKKRRKRCVVTTVEKPRPDGLTIDINGTVMRVSDVPMMDLGDPDMAMPVGPVTMTATVSYDQRVEIECEGRRVSLPVANISSTVPPRQDCLVMHSEVFFTTTLSSDSHDFMYHAVGKMSSFRMPTNAIEDLSFEGWVASVEPDNDAGLMLVRVVVT